MSNFTVTISHFFYHSHTHTISHYLSHNQYTQSLTFCKVLMKIDFHLKYEYTLIFKSAFKNILYEIITSLNNNEYFLLTKLMLLFNF